MRCEYQRNGNVEKSTPPSPGDDHQAGVEGGDDNAVARPTPLVAPTTTIVELLICLRLIRATRAGRRASRRNSEAGARRHGLNTTLMAPSLFVWNIEYAAGASLNGT